MVVGTLLCFGYVIIDALQSNNNPAAKDCDALQPLDVTKTGLYKNHAPNQFPDEVQLSLGSKTYLGGWKFGFMKKFTMYERGFFVSAVSEGGDMDHVVYGIYKDSALREPIRKKRIKDDLRKSDAIDEKGKYIYYEPYVDAVLDKGTYYAAIYTTNSHDNFKMTYQSRVGYYCLHHTLSEGKTLRFCVEDKKQVNRFKLKGIRSNRIKVTVENGVKQVALCDKKDNIINTANFKDNKSGEGKHFTFFSVDRKRAYFLRIRSYYSTGMGDHFEEPWFCIKYENA